jgi:NADP-dependent 3-hydroxy acid dehydrogenase YdfG
MFAVVTGGSAGIGEAFAHRLAAEGWDLAIVARRRERLAELAEQLMQRYGTDVQVHVADLTVPGDVRRLERMIAGADVGMLVNNAGFAGYGRFIELDPEVIAKLIGVHVLAVSRSGTGRSGIRPMNATSSHPEPQELPRATRSGAWVPADVPAVRPGAGGPGTSET